MTWSIEYLLEIQQVQVKIKKQPEEEIDDNDGAVYMMGDDPDYNVGNEMYVIEPCESTESDADGDEYLEFEVDNGRNDDRSIQSTEDNGLIINHDTEYVRQPAKRQRESSAYDGSPSYKRVQSDRSLIEFQKKLMQMEYDDMRKLRHEKHQLEIAILKADLTHKTLEHQKQMEIMNLKKHDWTNCHKISQIVFRRNFGIIQICYFALNKYPSIFSLFYFKHCILNLQINETILEMSVY